MKDFNSMKTLNNLILALLLCSSMVYYGKEKEYKEGWLCFGSEFLLPLYKAYKVVTGVPVKKEEFESINLDIESLHCSSTRIPYPFQSSVCQTDVSIPLHSTQGL